MLTAKVHTFERALAFQVLEQSPEVAAYLQKIGGSYKANNGWTISTHKVPELNVEAKTIFLRGTNVDANRRVDRTWGLDSDRQRDSIIAEAELALAEFQWSIKNNPGGVHFVVVAAKTPSKPVKEGNTIEGKTTVNG